MAAKQYALSQLDKGFAQEYQPIATEKEAIKQALARSLETATPQCILLGKDASDAKIIYLAIGGQLYKHHDHQKSTLRYIKEEDIFYLKMFFRSVGGIALIAGIYIILVKILQFFLD